MSSCDSTLLCAEEEVQSTSTAGAVGPADLTPPFKIGVRFPKSLRNKRLNPFATSGLMPLSNLKPLSSSDANVDSGIKLTMLRCTFYRNFCGFMTAGLLVTDAWPFVAQMADNTFVHNVSTISLASGLHSSQDERYLC